MSDDPILNEETPGEDHVPTVEDRARDRGWRPLEEFEGDQDTWVDAKEFMFRGELMDTISQERRAKKQLEDELGSVKGSVQDLKSHFEKMAELEIKQRLKQLRSEKLQASNMGDDDRVLELEDEIDDLKEQTKAAKEEDDTPPKAQQMHPDVASWIKDNPWSDESSTSYDPALASEGMALLQAEVARQGNVTDIKGTLDNVRSKLERIYPEKLGTRRRASGSVDTNPPAGSRGKGGSLVSKMSAEQRKFGETFVKAGAYEKLEDYAKALKDLGEI